jgi:hypothetical protein
MHSNLLEYGHKKPQSQANKKTMLYKEYSLEKLEANLTCKTDLEDPNSEVENIQNLTHIS